MNKKMNSRGKFEASISARGTSFQMPISGYWPSTRYEGIAIAALLAFATEEKPVLAMRKITQYARDFEGDPKLARLPNMMKKALKSLLIKKCSRQRKILMCSLRAGELGHKVTW
jgi:hypothetical protein